MSQDIFNIEELLEDVKKLIAFTMKSIDLSNSRFVRNIVIEWLDNEVSITLPDYAIYIDKGRRANNRMPPITAMIDFIRHNNIKSTKLSEERLAFAMANAVAKKGIKPRPFIERLEESVTELVFDHMDAEIDSLINKFTN